MTANIEIKPLRSLKVSAHQIPAFGGVPNTSIQQHPLLIYHRCIRSTCSPSLIEHHLEEVGTVTPQWRYTMYSTSHFHSTTHEVLCISRGSAQLLFGGEDNPGKVETTVEKGDVIVVPAGVAHRLLKDLHGDFEMVGSYPPGANWDMCYGKKGEEEKLESIKNLAWFKKDPVYSDEGPVLMNWDT
jgi:uncharacterized protein YjlB